MGFIIGLALGLILGGIGGWVGCQKYGPKVAAMEAAVKG